jgi:tetratricopeptide (TPR) repeat protein
LSGIIELWSGDYIKAEQIYSQLGSRIHLGYSLWKKGQEEEAKKLFSQSVESINLRLDQGNENPSLPLNLAMIYSIEGNMIEAYKWLKNAVDAGYKWYAWIEKDPLMENFHNDDQFKQITSQMKIEVEEMRKRVIKR